MSVIGDQYAVALFELALEENRLDETKNALATLLESFNEETVMFLTHPAITKKTKKETFESLGISNLLRDFMYVVIDNQRVLELQEILQSFAKLIESQADIMRIDVYSGKPLNKERIKELNTQYEKKYNRQVIIENHVDPSIVGGLRFEFQGVVIDDTVNHTIHQIKSRLTK